ncbi:MAG: MaoC family dehydratase N-terminal domain-containing protein [Acidimicrobiales bacterium]|nr:MaoC family dehydratase N-terminal domain-containing protein [Acidimicrobiales bacterium]
MNRGALGREYPARATVVSASAIRRVALAVGNDEAIHHDEAAARREGFRSIVAPIGAVMAAGPGGKRGADIHEAGPLHDLEIDFSKALFGGMEVEYHDVLCAGDELVTTGRISDIYERETSTGTMVVAVFETSYTTRDGEPVMTSRMTFLERA